jgi:hypothetical protein
VASGQFLWYFILSCTNLPEQFRRFVIPPIYTIAPHSPVGPFVVGVGVFGGVQDASVADGADDVG